MHRHIICAACTASFVVLLAGCKSPGTNQGPVVYRVPILETIVQANSGLRIVPETPDGSYTILGTPLRFRVQGDVNLKVLVNGAELPRRAQATANSGWYEPAGRPLKSGSRIVFWDIAVVLPSRVFDPGMKEFLVTFDYETAGNAQQPTVAVKLRMQGRDPGYAQAMPRPSEVFVGSTENTKTDNRMETAIVASGVTVAGWLFDPHRNDEGFAGRNGSEDWHYDLYLDPDFIERNYGSPVQVEPIKSARLPGNLHDPGPAATPIALLSSDPASPMSRPTAATFTLPGNGIFTVELNAWHKWARGPHPGFWQDDPDGSQYSGNAWPFNPYKGSANLSSRPNLKAGDYVIVSGTLWQDLRHNKGLRECIDDRFKGHGGWLELHPVDAVRLVDGADSPQPRKHVIGFAACNPLYANFDYRVAHPEPPPDDTALLRYEVIVDDRFTSSDAVHTEVVESICEPPLLHITADVPNKGSFNATYILWWEKSNRPRQKGAICIPALTPILGPADD